MNENLWHIVCVCEDDHEYYQIMSNETIMRSFVFDPESGIWESKMYLNIFLTVHTDHETFQDAITTFVRGGER